MLCFWKGKRETSFIQFLENFNTFGYNIFLIKIERNLVVMLNCYN